MNEVMQTRALEMLNAMLAIDREAVQAVIDHRVSINPRVLESHAPGVVGIHPNGATTLGPLGLINGLLCDAKIAAVYDEAQRLVEFVAASGDV